MKYHVSQRGTLLPNKKSIALKTAFISFQRVEERNPGVAMLMNLCKELGLNRVKEEGKEREIKQISSRGEKKLQPKWDPKTQG